MKKLKKLTSAFLAVVLVLGMLTIAPLTANAAITANQLEAYKLTLKEVHDNPLDYVELFNNNKADIEKCEFAIADVNEDGIDDLIVNFNYTYTYAIRTEIVSFNSYNQPVSLGVYSNIIPEFYKNGYMVTKSTHNQTPGDTIWPYGVHSFNYSTNDFSNYIYYAYCIDKDHDFNNSYDASLDRDKDGVIYVVNGEYLTKKEYDAYVNAYVPRKNKKNISWKKITNSNINNINAPTSVKLNRSTLTLGVGEKYGLLKTISPSYANQSCKWSSSKSSVASVDSTGKVTAKKAGTANITAKTSNGKTATCKVTVKPAPTSVKVSNKSLTLGKGEKFTVSQSTNSGSYAWGFKWTSSNPNVASVAKTKANKAEITAKSPGTADIKITTYNGKTATCRVTVKPAPASVTLTESKLTLGKGETFVIAQNSNSGSYAKNFTWSSSNSGVASVAKTSGNKAKITAKKTGTATITIKTYNGKTATCKVTVKPAPTSVKTNPASVTLGVGESYTISESTSSGSYANAANLKWSSTNTSVASVTKGASNKATITAKGVGTAYVKIKLYNGKTAQCKVTVKPAPTSVKTNPKNVTLRIGESYTISESTNSGSYANAANLKWSSSNSSVATVKKGSGNKAIITAKKVGTTTVTIKLYNGKTATCKVTVNKKVAGVPNYNGISSVEQSIFNDMNNARKKEGKAPLKWDSELYPAAKIRANEHVYWDTDGKQSYYPHNRPNGEPWDTACNDVGLGNVAYSFKGENLDITNNRDGIFDDWMDSPPHRESIFDKNFTHVAICVVKHGDFYYACAFFRGAKLKF